MGEQHFDLLSELHRDIVLAGFCDAASDLSGVFLFFTYDLSSIGFWATLSLRRAGLADVFQGAITGRHFAGWPSVQIGVIAVELL